MKKKKFKNNDKNEMQMIFRISILPSVIYHLKMSVNNFYSY